MSDLTRVLQCAADGDAQAAEELLPLVYAELRQLAAAKMAREQPGQTLQPTALVHEAWLRISGNENLRWENRRHFFGAAAEAMRRILIERARRRLRLRHGGGQERVEVEEVELPAPAEDEQLLDVHEALEELTRANPEQAEIVKLRFFAGLTSEETAAALGVSEKTVQRAWNHAKAWLYQHIQSRN